MSDALQHFADAARHLQQELDAQGLGDPVKRERDELRAEVERLRQIELTNGRMLDGYDQDRAEIGRLQAELADYKAGAEEEARAGDEARTEVERLQIELTNCQQVRDMAVSRLQAGGIEAEVERLRAELELSAKQQERLEHEDGLLRVAVERWRTALLLIEEVTTDPKLDDKSARGSAWSFAAVALET